MEAGISGNDVVYRIFESHWNYYWNSGAETIKQQASQLEQVSSDYQGRVIYELLQNAFDKAEQQILVSVVENSLYVANDGAPFTYAAGYDYAQGGTKRQDFQSLCSIATSTKEAATSIGNKGVGFKAAFSIAASGYVNIHTKGRIVNSSTTEEAEITFRIYHTFKAANEIPSEFPEKIKTFLGERILQIQAEGKNWGVPGYYFPMLIDTSQNSYIQELFAKGYVTIIEVPFGSWQKNRIRSLCKEIEATHFQFVQLKRRKLFKLDFVWDGKSVTQQLTRDPKLFTTVVNTPALRVLAQKAGVQIANPSVALYFKERPGALLYNYLPTKVASPFPYVDFHADFHTKVDRTAINFDDSTDIGAYNSALLRACLELYFVMLNTYLDKGRQVALQLEFINPDLIKIGLSVMRWEYLTITDDIYLINPIARSILQLSNNWYESAISFIAYLAQKYFRGMPAPQYVHQLFFDNCAKFADSFARVYGGNYSWPVQFRRQLALKLREVDARVIPAEHGKAFSVRNELIYRERKGQAMAAFIPDFVGINLFSFEVKDVDFRKALDIKEFTDRNEILKHYRQVSPSGEYLGRQNALTITQQQELLRSISTLMGKTDEQVLSTHRYTHFISRAGTQENTPANLANFSVSTVFLKTKGGRYKPAQLLHIAEVDRSFLPSGINEEVFLKFLGVSDQPPYRFVDGTMWKALNDGLDYIPGLWKDGERRIVLRHSDILQGLLVVTNKNAVHPACINDNGYSFLETVGNRDIKAELDNLLVKRYDVFPAIYLNILMEKLVPAPVDIERLYPLLFLPLHKKQDKHLIYIQDRYEWRTAHEEFLIVKNRDELRLVKHNALPVLCYYNDIPDELEHKVIQLEEDGIISKGNVVSLTEAMMQLFDARIVYLLSAISNAPDSKLDFRNDRILLDELKRRLDGLELCEVDGIIRKMKCIKSDGQVIQELEFDSETAIDRVGRRLYFKRGCSSRVKTDAICRYLFNNVSIVSECELILFFKQIEDLDREFSEEDISFLKSRWVPNYNSLFRQFEEDILNGFADFYTSPDVSWYIYNKDHRSALLIALDRENKLNYLRERIRKAKEEQNGLFDHFDLQIDYREQDERVAGLLTHLRTIQDDKALQLIRELELLIGRLGQEEELQQLENTIRLEYGYKDEVNSAEVVKKAAEHMDKARRVKDILSRLSTPQPIETSTFTIEGQSTSTLIPVDHQKKILKGAVNADDGEYLASIGASGEEQVLGYYINQFLLLEPLQRKEALVAVYTLVENSMGSTEHKQYLEDCLQVLKDDESLKKALIPFFYISLHYPYAYFDLVVSNGMKPLAVEVKTTSSKTNTSFYISKAEVNAARSIEHYELVRVTPTEIIFMGNPIKMIEDKLISVRGENYHLLPLDYKFEFLN